MPTTPDPPSLDLARLAEGLPAHGLGFPRRYAPSIPSTNSLAMELIAAGQIAPGTIILTDTQPAGRGRHGRAWVTLPGMQILLSVVLDLPFAPHLLVMAAALAACRAVETSGILSAQAALKWPNDVQVQGKKVAGILIETTTATPAHLTGVVGLGMNVNGSLAPWPDLAERATTLESILGHPTPREPIILAFLDQFGELTADLAGNVHAQTALHAAWRARLGMLGQSVTVHQGEALLSGIAEDAGDDGALLLRRPDGTRQSITWGDVL